MKRAALLLPLLALVTACTTTPPHASLRPRPAELWIDLVRGDEVTDDEVLTDLATAGVVYAGEFHAIARHHEIQLSLLQQLFVRRVPLVLGLEQIDVDDQPAIERYNRREIDYDTLVREIDWPKKWRNYADYRALCEFARAHRIPIRALNAPAEIVRAVNRGGGLAQLPADQRARLPADIVLDDPAYEKITTLEFGVHAGMEPAKLRPMFEAQVVRDETMAAAIVDARRNGEGPPRTVFAVLGAGHIRFGLGTAARVRRRDPGIVERLVLLSESGQLQLTAAEKSSARDVAISHADLRALGRPPADYLRVLPVMPVTLPPGHPPIGR
jgi:uncharacterized iron-regulated protein